MKVDKSKFEIVDTYWYCGDAWGGPPGYRLYVKLKGTQGVYELTIIQDKLNRDWILEDKRDASEE